MKKPTLDEIKDQSKKVVEEGKKTASNRPAAIAIPAVLAVFLILTGGLDALLIGGIAYGARWFFPVKPENDQNSLPGSESDESV